MLDILKFMVSDFWIFVGCVIVLNVAAYYAVNGITSVWSRLMRVIMVSIRGWPPSHLDADGDWESKNDDTLNKDILS